MTMRPSERLRNARVRDFGERASWDEEGVRECPGLGRYVLNHPLADEAALLAELKLDPASCLKADLYWEWQGDVMFVQIMTEEYSGDRRRGYYVRRAPSGYINVVAVVAEDAVDSSVVSRVLRRIAESEIDARTLGSSLEPVEGGKDDG